jgi:hypothetical protein
MSSDFFMLHLTQVLTEFRFYTTCRQDTYFFVRTTNITTEQSSLKRCALQFNRSLYFVANGFYSPLSFRFTLLRVGITSEWKLEESRTSEEETK